MTLRTLGRARGTAAMLTSTLRKQEFSHPGAALVVCLLLVGATGPGCESSHGGTTRNDASVLPADASKEDDASQDDADVMEELDAGPDAEDTSTPQPMPEIEQGQPCETDAQCDDHIYCNGAERCAQPDERSEPVCQPALRLPCSAEHPCREALEDCECSDADRDNDQYAARECGGEDCNDGRVDCFPGATEVCDRDYEDEDCDPTTYNNQSGSKNLDGDADGDGRIDDRCRNQDPETGEWHGGIDCDDHNPSIHREASEVCDYHDNNCNGFVDEKLNEDGTSEEVNGGLMVTFRPDRDDDLYADREGEAVRACDFYQPPGYVLATRALDCNDEDRRINPDALELCDGKDNDCDGLVDVDDPELRREYDFVETKVLCEEGQWIIPEDGCLDKDRLWCPERGDPIEQGCRTDATRLTSCRACNTDCEFACGRGGCEEVAQLAAGGMHTCAITTEGRVACWGRGGLGILGNDSTNSSSLPVQVVGVAEVTGITAGREHSCAIAGPDALLVCWGSNQSGQLGAVNVEVGGFSAVATPVAGIDNTNRLTGVAQVSAGDDHTCAVLTNGNVVCFGARQSGRIGDGATTVSAPSLPVLARRRVYNPIIQVEVPTAINDARLVASGTAHSCIVTKSGFVECWGANANGQLADNSSQASAYAKRIPELSNVTHIAAGGNHTCAVSSGQVFCWGANDSLQLGRTQGSEEEYRPKAVADLVNVEGISANQGSTCALTTTRSAVCWGLTYLSRPDEPISSADPIRVPIDGEVTWITTGRAHSCARSEMHAFCWGDNQVGQLGVGNTSFDPERAPVPIASLAGSAR